MEREGNGNQRWCQFTNLVDLDDYSITCGVRNINKGGILSRGIGEIDESYLTNLALDIVDFKW